MQRENISAPNLAACLTGLLLSLATVPAVAQDDLSVETPAAATPVSAEGDAPLATIAVDPLKDAEPAPPPAAKPGNRFIEEIVVTAQKREENLQDVPISIAAFSGEALEARGANNAADLKFITPGLVYDSLVGYSLIYIRGIGTEVFAPHQEPSVATYIDGVYLPLAHGLAADFTKLKRIEVLKGPQGTLFGRNATGGAINIVSAKPSEVFGGNLDVGARSFSGRSAKLYLTGPIVDGLSFSVSGVYDKDDPYYDLAADSLTKRLQPNESKGVNARLMWEPTDDITALVSGYSSRFFGTGTVVGTNTKPKPLGTLLGSYDAGDRTASVSEPETIDINSDIVYGSVEWRRDFADFKLLGSRQDAKTDTRWDYDGGPGNFVFFWPTNQFAKVTTAELQAVSNATTPGSEWFEWTTGLYYFKSEAGFDPLFVGVVNFDSPSVDNSLTGLFDGLESLNLPVPLPQSAANLILRGVLQTEALAAYAQLKWSPTDWVSLTLGGRYQNEQREMLKSSTGVQLDGINPDGGDVTAFNFLANREFKSDINSFSPRIAIDTKVFDDTLIYASYSQAEKSGTFNIVAIYTPPTFVRPEKLTAYELGIKGGLFDKTLRYNFALFRSDTDDLQTQVISLTAGGVVTLANAAKARIQGAEADFTWQVLPEALPGLVLTGSATVLDGEYTDFPEGSGFQEGGPLNGLFFGPGAAQPARDFSGNTTVRTPDFSGTFGVGYSLDLKSGVLEFGADVYYNSGYFFDTQNVVEQPEYYTLNARVSYLYQPWNVRVSLLGKNITDEFYYANIFAEDFGEAATAGPPSVYALTVSWAF